MVAARNRYSATYKTETAGQYRTDLSAGPVHYRDGEGWEKIDASLRQRPDGRFGNGGRNEFGLSVAPDNRDRQLTRMETKSGRAVGFALEGARPGGASPDPQTGAETIVYRSILPHVDLRLSSLADGLKEILVLQSAQAPTRYVFPLTTDGLRAELDDQGQVLYRDAAGAVVFVTPRPWMEDSANGPDLPGATSYEAAFRLLDTAEGGQALELTISEAWLKDPSRVFPALVDPTIYNTEPYFDTDTYYYKANTTNASTANTALRAGASGSDHYRAFLMFNGRGGTRRTGRRHAACGRPPRQQRNLPGLPGLHRQLRTVGVRQARDAELVQVPGLVRRAVRPDLRGRQRQPDRNLRRRS